MGVQLIYIYIYICMCVCVYVYIYTYIYIYIHIHTVPSTTIVYPFDLSFKKFTKFQPIIEVKQLKVGGNLIVK